MKLIESKVEIIEQQPGLEGVYKQIELAGRTCYKSENLITETSGVDFTRRIMSYNHGSVLEHAYLAFKVDENLYNQIDKKHYPFFVTSNITYPIVSFNFRAFYNTYLNYEDECLHPIYKFMEEAYPELFKLKHSSSNEVVLITKEELMKLTTEEKDLHLSITIKFITDRGVTHELVRHRLASFAQESTRYCNYGKEKFAHEITFVETHGMNENQKKIWKTAMENAEMAYFDMLDNGAPAEVCRSVLPNSLKTEIVVTATMKEWKIIFDLRCSPAAHPDIRFLMIDTRDYFLSKEYL